jgi:hypothetical protein
LRYRPGELRSDVLSEHIGFQDTLRCKEIWVIGANRYRNPDEDLPTDFELRREEYYQALKLPLDADRFITELQSQMCQALNTFDGCLLCT